MSRFFWMIGTLLLVAGACAFGQDAAERTKDVVLFQTFFQDAPIAANPYGEGFFQYSTYEGDVSSIDIDVLAGVPLTPLIQVSGGLGFRSISPDVGDSQSGITDLAVSGRYNVVSGQTPISVGALATLPIGSDDIGEGSFDFSGFGSLRHHLPSGPAITGTIGLEFVETKGIEFNRTTGEFDETTDHETSILIAGGIIVPTQSGLNFLGELDLRTEGDYVLLTGGLDYALASGGRLRGGLGIGLDDGAPEFALRFGYFMGFAR